MCDPAHLSVILGPALTLGWDGLFGGAAALVSREVELDGDGGKKGKLRVRIVTLDKEPEEKMSLKYTGRYTYTHFMLSRHLLPQVLQAIPHLNKTQKQMTFS